MDPKGKFSDARRPDFRDLSHSASEPWGVGHEGNRVLIHLYANSYVSFSLEDSREMAKMLLKTAREIEYQPDPSKAHEPHDAESALAEARALDQERADLDLRQAAFRESVMSSAVGADEAESVQEINADAQRDRLGISREVKVDFEGATRTAKAMEDDLFAKLRTPVGIIADPGPEPAWQVISNRAKHLHREAEELLALAEYLEMCSRYIDASSEHPAPLLVGRSAERALWRLAVTSIEKS